MARRSSSLAAQTAALAFAAPQVIASRMLRMTPAEFQAYVAKQVADFAPAVKASGAKLN